VKSKKYYIYVMASRSRTLYVGVTGDLEHRVDEHKRGALPGFTSRYRVSRLVYFEATENARSAIAREKEMKGWRRAKKVALIESGNPTWDDLAAEWSEGEGKADPEAGPPSCHPEAPKGPRDLLVRLRRQARRRGKSRSLAALGMTEEACHPEADLRPTLAPRPGTPPSGRQPAGRDGLRL
jgi:putative endonuclease